MTTAPETGATAAEAPALTTEDERQRYAAISRALADAKRLCVLECLSQGERSVSDLSREASCQVPNMSQHLAVLREQGLVTTRRQSQTIFYSLADTEAIAVMETLHRIYCEDEDGQRRGC